MPNNVFDGSEGAYISLSKASQFRQTYESSSQYTDNQGVKGHFFGKTILEDMLNQTGAIGLRIYYGLKPISGSDDEPQLIIVAADAQGNDITNQDKIADASSPCPPYCSEAEDD